MCITRVMKGVQSYRTRGMRCGEKVFDAIIADTYAKRMIGLMHRDDLDTDTAMLFVFPFPGRHGIWMRNMRFRIDVLWLDREMRIIDVRKNVRTCRSLFDFATYYPKKEALYILEGKAGFAARHSLRVGSKLRWSSRIKG